MQGSLFVYAPGRQAFVTGSLQKKAAVLLGGLSDGLLACPYAPPLAKALEALGYGCTWGHGSSRGDERFPGQEQNW